MKDYLLLFRGGLNFATATAEEIQQAMGKWGAWMAELRNKGIFNSAERLDRQTGAFIRGTSDKKQVTDGPYTEAKEVVGGFVSIKASDLQSAVEIAQGCPIFNYEGTVEVREVIKM